MGSVSSDSEQILEAQDYVFEHDENINHLDMKFATAFCFSRFGDHTSFTQKVRLKNVSYTTSLTLVQILIELGSWREGVGGLNSQFIRSRA